MKIAVTALLGTLAAIAVACARPAHAGGRRLALVVGTSTYADPTWTGLVNAATDAERIADLLERRFAYDVIRLIDRDRDTFKRSLATLSEAAAEADDLLVFVAGHGHFDPTDKAGYLVFADADPTCDRGCYPLDNIKRALFGTRARHVLVMLDACYAGTFDPAIAFGGGTFARRGEIVPAHLRQILQDHAAARSRLVFASVGRAPTLDGTPGQAHSPFARILLAELERAVTTGAVSIDRIAIVMKEGPEPLPVLAPTSFPAALPHDVNGTFLFVAAADLCADFERVIAQARKTTSGTTGAPAGARRTRSIRHSSARAAACANASPPTAPICCVAASVVSPRRRSTSGDARSTSASRSVSPRPRPAQRRRSPARRAAAG